ncbi:TIGR03085 family metal-binding protein [Rothia terrae]|uniref:TIGR03085 family protein n=1 Tax=Rothia terrae TaxID=396015 RepID=A0A7H2BBG8_9MICC|nr:TIGR03085 family metal-binding protein [Rothia terrae]QNV37014.1 TIGR03085 family protein [Rothia terrae]
MSKTNTPLETQPMDAGSMVTAERHVLADALFNAGPDAPTLCEGWQTRHLLAHLILRESKPDAVAGIALPFLADRTDRLTNEYADKLRDEDVYEDAINTFVELPGYFKMRENRPQLDANMNLIEYFVHIEDIRRAEEHWEPRKLQPEIQQKMWSALTKRARLMAGKKYPNGLVLAAPGYSPDSVTVISPKSGQRATVLTGEPGELVLYLFGREQARVTVS